VSRDEGVIEGGWEGPVTRDGDHSYLLISIPFSILLNDPSLYRYHYRYFPINRWKYDAFLVMRKIFRK
jgi:hypothetical protein